jgi:hypothetical protein
VTALLALAGEINPDHLLTLRKQDSLRKWRPEEKRLTLQGFKDELWYV